MSRDTYLVISNTLEVLQRNVIADGWQSECSVPISFLSHNVSAIRLCGLAEIFVRFDLRCVWLAVDATGGIPGVLTLYVLDAVDEI